MIKDKKNFLDHERNRYKILSNPGYHLKVTRYIGNFMFSFFSITIFMVGNRLKESILLEKLERISLNYISIMVLLIFQDLGMGFPLVKGKLVW